MIRLRPHILIICYVLLLQALAESAATTTANITTKVSLGEFRAPVLCHRPTAVLAPMRPRPRLTTHSATNTSSPVASPAASSSTTILRHAPPPPPPPPRTTQTSHGGGDQSRRPTPTQTRRYRFRGRYLPVVAPAQNAEQSALLHRPSAHVIELTENARGEYVIDDAQLDPNGLYVEEVWNDRDHESQREPNESSVPTSSVELTSARTFYSERNVENIAANT